MKSPSYTEAMLKGARGRSKIFFIALGSLVVVLTIALNVGWILINWRTGLMLSLGVVFFGLIIAGVVLNTIFLVREIRRNEQHDAFINSVTHELKTPVASIRLYLQTLQSREVDETKRQEFYQVMLADSDRLVNTIEQVLRAARTSSSRPVSSVKVDLRDVVRECVETARMQYHLSAEALTFTDSAPEDCTVLGDRDELRAAVANLLDNAIKYSLHTVQVATELQDDGAQHLSVRVSDSGVGIPPADLKKVFKRFYRVPSAVAQRVKGTGLGLFIVRSVAERHGGRAWAESDGPGHGCTFTLELPAWRS